MTNAKEEFITAVGKKKVLCASLTKGSEYWPDDSKQSFPLKVGFTLEDYENYLNTLDFTYDAGYGGQELFGVIWYVDDTWSERGEYDGSEWWEHRCVPPVPDELKEEQC